MPRGFHSLAWMATGSRKTFLFGSGDCWSVLFEPKVALLRTGVHKFLSVSPNHSGTQQPARQFRNPKCILECGSPEMPSHLLSVSTVTSYSQTYIFNQLFVCSGNPLSRESCGHSIQRHRESRPLCDCGPKSTWGNDLYLSGIRLPLTTLRSVYCVDTFCMLYADPV